MVQQLETWAYSDISFLPFAIDLETCKRDGNISLGPGLVFQEKGNRSAYSCANKIVKSDCEELR